jgi:hypothetical protein
MMDVEPLVEWELVGEIEVLGENLFQHHFVYHKSHMARARTPGRRGGKPATNGLSYGTAFGRKLRMIQRYLLPHSYMDRKLSQSVIFPTWIQAVPGSTAGTTAVLIGVYRGFPKHIQTASLNKLRWMGKKTQQCVSVNWQMICMTGIPSVVCAINKLLYVRPFRATDMHSSKPPLKDMFG